MIPSCGCGVTKAAAPNTTSSSSGTKVPRIKGLKKPSPGTRDGRDHPEPGSSRYSQSTGGNWKPGRFSLTRFLRELQRRAIVDLLEHTPFRHLPNLLPLTPRAAPAVHNGFLGHHNRPRRGRHPLGDGRRRGPRSGVGMSCPCVTLLLPPFSASVVPEQACEAAVAGPGAWRHPISNLGPHSVAPFVEASWRMEDGRAQSRKQRH